MLVLPGSQAAIQGLPALFSPVSVACLSPTYEEHAQAWTRAGHKLRRLPTLARALAAATPNVLLCNPNNPTATTLPRSALLDAAGQLQHRGGWLIVDEAFADPEPDNGIATLAGSADAPNLIVLRSLGKFFGLAGARVGFVFAASEKLDRLRELIGPWPVAHPSRAVARLALADLAWQDATRKRLAYSSQRLAECLAPFGEVNRTALFCTLNTAHVAALFEHLARRAILTRRFDQLGLLRFGLPGQEAEWQRLALALAEWNPPC
jgi:cobalamin biosynthetic protein CobC